MAARKKATKKAAKKAVRKTPARKVATPAAEKPAKAPKEAPASGKRFAYLIETPEVAEGGPTGKTISNLAGPFTSEDAAIEDASIMAEANSVITIFRSAKSGSVQKSTKFVAKK
jgi:hypothetical protein